MRTESYECRRCKGSGASPYSADGFCINCDGLGLVYREIEEATDAARRMAKIGKKYGPSSPLAVCGNAGYSWEQWVALPERVRHAAENQAGRPPKAK
jgi:hypothetical protein